LDFDQEIEKLMRTVGIVKEKDIRKQLIYKIGGNKN